MGPEDGELVSSVLRQFKGYQHVSTAGFLRDERTVLLVAEEQEQLVGWLYAYELIRPEGRKAMLLYEVEVETGFRERGHGRELVDHLLEEARSRGCFTMWTLTDENNAAAASFYESTGGHKTGQNLYDWRLD